MQAVRCVGLGQPIRASALVVALVLSLTVRAAWADMRPVELRTRPGGAEIVENGSVVARGEGEGGERCAFEADTSGEHRYVIRRSGFDERPLRLVWDADVARWRVIEGSSTVADFLQPGQVVGLSKTMRLNTDPADVEAAIEVLPQQTHTRVTSIYGREHCWLDLARAPDGRVTLPNAADRQMVLLSHAGFADYPLVIDENQLTDAGDVFPATPVSLKPLYGPFSYWRFNVAAGVLAIIAVAGYLGVYRPRSEAGRRERERQLSLAAAITENVEASPGRGDASAVGATVTTDGGDAFVLLRELGRGAMGAVYEACGTGERRGTDERWAVKMLFSGSNQVESLARFRREVKICSSLHHPGIVKVLDSGMHVGRAGEAPAPFIVMERVSGQTLRKLLDDRGGRLSPGEAVGYVREMLGALRVAHRAGIVHRDLKPDNVMITSSDRVKIMDFGISRMRDGDLSLTQTGVAMGTPRYMSPEHVQAKEVTPAADLFSLGVMLYEMLSGRVPFDSDDVWKLISLIMSSDPVPLQALRPDLSPALCGVVAQMMARDLAVRYRDADAVLAALDAARVDGVGR